jgi:glyoxylase-like metal-dependent hydrolase (beta-lactamase superfamily II)
MTADVVSELGSMSATELKFDVPPECFKQVDQVAFLREYGPATNRQSPQSDFGGRHPLPGHTPGAICLY